MPNFYHLAYKYTIFVITFNNYDYMKKLFQVQRIIISIQFMHLVFDENTVIQQNVTKFYRIQKASQP